MKKIGYETHLSCDVDILGGQKEHTQRWEMKEWMPKASVSQSLKQN
jgi:hypothetical protein